MRRLLACVLVVLWAPAASAQQAARTDSIAVAGGSGIYVWLGGSVVSPAHPVGGTVAHRVERRPAAGGAWQRVADVSAVSDAAALFGPLDTATRATVRRALRATTDDSAWAFIVAHPTADSLSLLLGHETIRLALGLYALDRNVRAGDRWQYRVSRLDAAGGTSAPVVSNVVAYPGPQLPDSVHTLRVDQAEAQTRVWWRLPNPTRVRWLEIWRRQGATGAFTLRDSVAAFLRVADSLQATYHDTTVVAGNIYQYYAVPRDFFFNAGPASDTITAYTVNAVRLAAPDSLVARGIDSLGIELRWSFATPGLARSFRIYRSVRQDSGWHPLVDVAGTDRRFVDDRIVPMRTYYYRLTTLGLKADESPATAAVFAHFATRVPPQPPMDVRVDSARGGLRVRWSPNRERDIQGYFVYRTDLPVDSAVDASTVQLVSPLVPASDTSWEDSTAHGVAGRQWTYVVQALNTSNLRSAFSAPATAPVDLSASAVAPPPIPTGLSAVQSGGRVRVTWNDMSDADPSVTGYAVARREVGARDTNHVVVATLGRNVNAWWDSTVTVGRAYEYAVRSRNFAGTSSGMTTPVRVTVTRPAPLAPTDARARTAANGVTISWGNVVGVAARVRVYRYERGATPRVVAEVAADPPQYLDRTARRGVRYFYYLTFVVDGVEGARTAEISVRR